MKKNNLLVSAGIVACTCVAWTLLGSAIGQRTRSSTSAMRGEVSGVWGPALVQEHPDAYYLTPNAPDGRAEVLPATSKVTVALESEPKRRGLLWHRTYGVDFKADYTFANPTRIPQTFYLRFALPPDSAGLHGFVFQLDGVADSATAASNGVVTRAVVVPAGESVPLHVAYRTRGTDSWNYSFPDNRRITGFDLRMRVNFADINFPVGTGSPDQRQEDATGWDLAWLFPDVLSAPDIGMDMPKLLNAGPVAQRIVMFAPVSLLFFISVVMIIAALKGIPLHPMHVFFVSAGFFAFHLLFAYLVDLLSPYASFAVASGVSLLLVAGYLRAIGGRLLFRVAVPAQLTYLTLFSLSFFFDGLTGITLAVVSVLTLALLMFLTARVDWRGVFGQGARPA
ncbi:inner membrane CreD family protein [Luteolibacter marinus]|uniref:inner membrane CreD family protein n=1 Tax=Luteolibacter marinus TaxID=2776705 RepID=UPI001868A84D|nr:inner membrane CreD family protein [Luteolibacter marinus]